MPPDTALFHRDGESFVPSEYTRGPWDPNAQHGGAPSGLFAYVLERYDPGPASFVARLTVELLRPVPMAPLTIAARTIRPGRKVQWLEASAFAGDVEVARATALRVREAEVDVRDSVSPVVDTPMPPAEIEPFSFGPHDVVGMWSTQELRLASGNWMEAGPATIWFRLLNNVVDDEAPSPLQRVATCADFGSGVGSPLRSTKATGINAEVTIHLHRPAVGEWVCLESSGFAGSNGVGLAESRLHDEAGPIGRAAQSLLVESITVRQPPGSRFETS